MGRDQNPRRTGERPGAPARPARGRCGPQTRPRRRRRTGAVHRSRRRRRRERPALRSADRPDPTRTEPRRRRRDQDGLHARPAGRPRHHGGDGRGRADGSRHPPQVPRSDRRRRGRLREGQSLTVQGVPTGHVEVALLRQLDFDLPDEGRLGLLEDDGPPERLHRDLEVRPGERRNRVDVRVLRLLQRPARETERQGDARRGRGDARGVRG